jgi:hypothetical protein
MPEVEEYFVDSGVRPGFPGNHGPGWYLVDYTERTIRPKPVDVVDTFPVEEAPSEPHSDAIIEAQQQGGVIPPGQWAIVGEAGGPELLTIPEGATVTLNPQEGADPASSE